MDDSWGQAELRVQTLVHLPRFGVVKGICHGHRLYPLPPLGHHL